MSGTVSRNRFPETPGIGTEPNAAHEPHTALLRVGSMGGVRLQFVLPHASLRQPLLVPESTYGTGSAKVWRPCTPAMAAGVTDHVWTLQEVLRYRVPPWPQPQAL